MGSVPLTVLDILSNNARRPCGTPYPLSGGAMKTPRSFVSHLLAVSFAITLLVIPNTAQVRTGGEIAGAVIDPSQAIVPGAELRLTDLASGSVQTLTANKEGGFTFVNLRPGSYQISASSPGFQTTVYNGIVVDAGRTTNIAVKLQVGAVQQEVEVNA